MTVPVYQWQPTTADIARRAGLSPDEVIRFDHNTSPIRSEWAAGPAASLAVTLNEYPGADYRDLREAAARYAGVGPEQVVAGAGADELILLATRAFLPSGATAVTASPTYSLYRVATAQQGAVMIDVPRPGPDFRLPTAGLVRAAAGADLVWLCVPNNPTGRRDADADLDAVIEAAAGVVVVDAAYAEFAGDRWADRLDRHPNLIVLHTLSKAFGLAGIRVGYSLSSVDLAVRLHRVRPPGSISTLSDALGIAALERPERAAATVEAITSERERLAGLLGNLGLDPLASTANFLLSEIGPGAHDLEQSLLEEGLVVRRFAPPLDHYLRFTVRTPDQDDRLVAALQRRLA